jgi:Zn-dependent protease
MRDPMSWSVPVFRAFGIPVRVHIFFIIIALGMFLRLVTLKNSPIWWVDVFVLAVVLPFVIVLLHEFGHCFGARAVDGDAKEILMWPLGGLAYIEVPHTPRANWIATAAGPGVNVLVCVACAAGLISAGFRPNLNPVANPIVTEMKHGNGRVYTSEYGIRLYKPGTAERVPSIFETYEEQFKDSAWRERSPIVKPAFGDQLAALAGAERAVAPGWAAWLQRAFTISWFLFLFNLIPAYPLDGGVLLQCYVWKRRDYRRGVQVAAYSGYAIAVVFFVVAVWQNEALFMGLSLFMLYRAATALQQLEAEEGPFGYDFSAGYTSLEKDDPPPPKPKRPGFLTRWRQARLARKIQREQEERAAEAERMDQLLEKIARSGKESLTDDERRFLERVSARYRNRS